MVFGVSVPKDLEKIGVLHPDGWPGLMAATRELVLRGRAIVGDTLSIDEPTPAEVIDSMATIPMPGDRSARTTGDLDPLTERLRKKRSIEVPVFVWRNWPKRLLRISTQRYNERADYQRLAEAPATDI